ncbi:hypothetical protein VTH06DRAFT_8667 [Thermothelomyces fergusii]
MLRGTIAVGAACLAQLVAGFDGPPFRTSLTLRDFREQMERRQARDAAALSARESDLQDLYPAHTLQVPVDHFHNDSLYEPHSSETFPLRYWFDASHYKKGGPVIVLQSGETSGVGRLPFLQKGIVAQLARATNGLGVILEHRYYGESIPTPDFGTENLRFLTTDQALADMAYFARHVVFEGLEHLDLTAPKNPYIAYGGSYAGAFVAFLRKAYPDVYWGAISSSGVPEAIYDYWQYYEAARIYAPHDCVVATQELTHIVDNILLGQAADASRYVDRLKAGFGLGGVTRNDDFANAISWGIGGLQGLNWDPALNETQFGEYCNNLTATEPLYPTSPALEREARELVRAGGYGKEADRLAVQLLNYMGYVKATTVQTCRKDSQDECFTNYNSTFYQQDDKTQEWRLWPYQYCLDGVSAYASTPTRSAHGPSDAMPTKENTARYPASAPSTASCSRVAGPKTARSGAAGRSRRRAADAAAPQRRARPRRLDAAGGDGDGDGDDDGWDSGSRERPGGDQAVPGRAGGKEETAADGPDQQDAADGQPEDGRVDHAAVVGGVDHVQCGSRLSASEKFWMCRGAMACAMAAAAAAAAVEDGFGFQAGSSPGLDEIPRTIMAAGSVPISKGPSGRAVLATMMTEAAAVGARGRTRLR